MMTLVKNVRMSQTLVEEDEVVVGLRVQIVVESLVWVGGKGLE